MSYGMRPGIYLCKNAHRHYIAIRHEQLPVCEMTGMSGAASERDIEAEILAGPFTPEQIAGLGKLVEAASTVAGWKINDKAMGELKNALRPYAECPKSVDVPGVAETRQEGA